jgi:hypothetical protein
MAFSYLFSRGWRYGEGFLKTEVFVEKPFLFPSEKHIIEETMKRRRWYASNHGSQVSYGKCFFPAG